MGAEARSRSVADTSVAMDGAKQSKLSFMKWFINGRMRADYLSITAGLSERKQGMLVQARAHDVMLPDDR